MTWFRGVREDYDGKRFQFYARSSLIIRLTSIKGAWESGVGDDWARENAATFEPEISGTDGPLQRSFVPWLGDTHIPFLQSFEKLGLKANPRANAGHNIGTFTATTVDPKTSQRSCVTTAYFEPNASRPNLHVIVGAQVNRVMMRQTPDSALYEASGVEFIHSSNQYQVIATKEVIVSAGAYLSPGILERSGQPFMLACFRTLSHCKSISGIGCSKRLEALNIQPLVDLPGVGENFQDHLLVPSSFELKDNKTVTGDLVRDPEFAAQELERYKREGGGMYASIHSAFSMLPLQSFVPSQLISKSVASLQSLLNSSVSPGQRKVLQIQQRWFEDPSRGQLEIMHVPEFCTPGASQPKKTGRYVSLLSVIMQPLSRGSVHVISPNPYQAPAIDPQYYSNPIDLQLMVHGLKYVQRLANTEPLSSLILKPVDPSPDQLDNTSLENYARKLLESAHHPVGTVSMMPRKEGGVVDSELRVYGIRNLRVADASIFPLSMSSHPQATLYALGEKVVKKAADILKRSSSQRAKL
ncbi:GMC oxidoreductase [Ceratobasidium sp. AG-Ba]|nr:GMC oxidoreductase [Ceratobasidium sp. AG-Ba]